jgi:hypothetical protein
MGVVRPVVIGDKSVYSDVNPEWAEMFVAPQVGRFEGHLSAAAPQVVFHATMWVLGLWRHSGIAVDTTLAQRKATILQACATGGTIICESGFYT